MKEYQIIFKMSNIIQLIEAKSREEAENIANKMIEEDEELKECFEFEVEEYE